MVSKLLSRCGPETIEPGLFCATTESLRSKHNAPFAKSSIVNITVRQARNQGEAFRAFASPKFSKHCIAILTFIETFKE